MHFIDPSNPPAGKQTPPFTAQSSKALCCVASRDTQGVGGGCHRDAGAHHSAPGLPSLPAPWGEAGARSWHFQVISSQPASSVEPKKECHTRERPGASAMLGIPAQRKHTTILSQPGHACHLVERPGHSGREPRPCGPAPEARWGHSSPWLTPNQAPLKNPALAWQCNRGAQVQLQDSHSKKQLQAAGLDPQKGFAQAQMVKLLLFHSTPSYAHLDIVGKPTASSALCGG